MIIMRFLVCLTSIQDSISKFITSPVHHNLSSSVPFAIINLKRIKKLDLSWNQKTVILEREEKEEGGGSKKHHEPSLQTWQVWTFFILGVLMILSVLAFILKLRDLRRRKSSEEFADQSPSTRSSSPTKDVEQVTMMKREERRSELVFFVEREEWFRMEDLLEGVAELRTQGFCSCLYVVRLKNGAVYAVKRLRKLQASSEDFGLAMRRVGELRHPNILPLVCYNNTLQEHLLIYRFQRNGSLLNLFESYAEGKRAFPWRLRLSIAAGIARGLDFIHHHGDIVIPHGIIKPSNIMLSEDDEPLISEYGYAKFVGPTAGPYPSMKGYAAPEKDLTEKADVYGFGVILLELLTGKSVEKSGSDDLPRWVRSAVREEWTGEVFDEEMSEVGMYAFPLLNVALNCVAHHSHQRPAVAEVLAKIEQVVVSVREDEG